jgi:hypothetical protein
VELHAGNDGARWQRQRCNREARFPLRRTRRPDKRAGGTQASADGSEANARQSPRPAPTRCHAEGNYPLCPRAPAQLESRKEKAVRFTRDVLRDPDRGEEIADESLEDYGQRRKIQITNPSKRKKAIMPTTKSKAELEAENVDLRDENQELQDQLDAVADIVAPDGDDDGQNGDPDDDDEDDVQN